MFVNSTSRKPARLAAAYHVDRDGPVTLVGRRAPTFNRMDACPTGGSNPSRSSIAEMPEITGP